MLFDAVTPPTVYASLRGIGLVLGIQRAGKSFPCSQLSTYQPHNKGSLWVCRRRRPKPSVQFGLVCAQPRASLGSFGLNSPPPSLEMETTAVVSAIWSA